MLPLSGATRDRLRQSYIARFPGAGSPRDHGQWTPTETAHRAMFRADAPAIGHVADTPAPSIEVDTTLVAFYLPQFHPIPENDRWWGKGFTEWRNVTRALPQFEGHVQPRLPADLGFYDLRDGRTMRQQAALARQYGIGAFCFYFYWFGGKTLLEAPLEQWLQDSGADLPFCLCWANESWARRWDGRDSDTLIAQEHSAQDDLAFIAHIARYLRDPRYLRVDGKPLILVYRPSLIPDARATAQRWRTWCADNGIGEICIAYTQSFDRAAPAELGFDAAVEFPPNMGEIGDITAQQRLINPDYRGQALDWRVLARSYQTRPMPPYRLFPAVNCGWDNEPRRPGLGRTFLHASPRRYRDWLRATIQSRLEGVPASDRLVFINAWNEWAEGAVLEPEARLGHAWLAATRAALLPEQTRALPCLVIHAWYADVLEEMLQVVGQSGCDFHLVITTSPEREDAVRRALEQHAARFPGAEVHVFENRGRDIRPFLHVASRLIDDGWRTVLKLHTKRSTHRGDGEAWRRDLLDRLVAPSRIRLLVEAFEQRADLGVIAPEGHVQPLDYFWGANEQRVRQLCTRIGIPAPATETDTFVAGSMFWIRLESLRPVLDAHLDDWEFEQERGQIDGTMAHAVERVISLAVRSAFIGQGSFRSSSRS